jgi:hypothetical protein
MSATIHYLRPFQREQLAETAAAPAAPDADIAPEGEDEPEARPEKRRGGRAMPCGRNSKWKKKIGGGVVARDKRD